MNEFPYVEFTLNKAEASALHNVLLQLACDDALPVELHELYDAL